MLFCGYVKRSEEVILVQEKDIEYFSAILQTGGISKAAKVLYISQPYLSQYLMRLETRIGAPLFDRNKTPWQLTDVGQCYADYAKEFDQMYARMEMDIQSVKQGNTIHQSLSIGIPPYKGTLILPSVLSQFCDRFPNVKITVYEEASHKLRKMLPAGKIDILIMNTPTYDKYIVYEKLTDERILLTTSKDHPLTMGKMTSLENPAYFDLKMLENQRFIIPGPNQLITREAQNLFVRRHMKPLHLLYLNDINTCLKLTALGYGFALIPELGLRQFAYFDKLAFFKPEEHDFSWSISIIYQNPKELSAAAKAFISIVKEQFSTKLL
ncbi:MAG: LysR family transcriptional regulator [Peptococcaceae bacterium]